MNSYQKVEKWLEEMDNKIELESCPMERGELRDRQHHIKTNLPYYIKGQLEKGTTHHFCVECGCIEFAACSQEIKSRLEEKQKCFSCDFHEEREKEYLIGTKSFLIIKGQIYSDAGATKGRNTKYNGFAGHEFTIRMLDGSKEWKTNNLWCGGPIPKKYRLTTMKDNAKFVK